MAYTSKYAIYLTHTYSSYGYSSNEIPISVIWSRINKTLQVSPVTLDKSRDRCGQGTVPARQGRRVDRIFLEELLLELLQSVPIAIGKGLWFQHDIGQPFQSRFALSPECHFSESVNWGCAIMRLQKDLIVRISVAHVCVREIPDIFGSVRQLHHRRS